MSTSDVAKVFGVTGERVRQIAEAGDLPVAGRTAGGRVYRREDVEALRDARAREAEERASRRGGDVEAS